MGKTWQTPQTQLTYERKHRSFASQKERSDEQKKKNTIRMLDANLVKWANVNSLYYANWTATMAKFIVDTPAHRHRGPANVSANAYDLTSVRMWHCADIEHCHSICIQINKQLAWVRDSHNWRLLSWPDGTTIQYCHIASDLDRMFWFSLNSSSNAKLW